jgi:hypothetical protein
VTGSEQGWETDWEHCDIDGDRTDLESEIDGVDSGENARDVTISRSLKRIMGERLAEGGGKGGRWEMDR